MKYLKKIAIVPFAQKHKGCIIDSFDTSDDKHTNAPSINAVKKYFNNTYKQKDDFVIITGNVTIAANDTGLVNINYPEGFNADNCVPITCGLQIIANKGYNYVGYNKDSGSILTNAYDRRLNLTSSNILFMIDNPNTSAKTISYKIVLMKV